MEPPTYALVVGEPDFPDCPAGDRNVAVASRNSSTPRLSLAARSRRSRRKSPVPGTRVPVSPTRLSSGLSSSWRPEVAEDDPTASVAHDVACLHVSVHESGLVHRLKRRAQLESDARQTFGVERSLFRQFRFERAAFDVLHPQAARP